MSTVPFSLQTILRITQGAVALMLFVPSSVDYTGRLPELDFVWAGLCMVGAVCSISLD